MKKLIILYQYLFYRIYVVWKKQTTEHDAAISAMFAISFLIGLNVISLIVILEKNVQINYKEDYFWGIPFSLFFFIPNYFLFLHKKKYISIENQFKNETKKQKTWSQIVIFSLIGITSAQIVYQFLR